MAQSEQLPIDTAVPAPAESGPAIPTEVVDQVLVNASKQAITVYLHNLFTNQRREAILGDLMEDKPRGPEGIVELARAYIADCQAIQAGVDAVLGPVASVIRIVPNPWPRPATVAEVAAIVTALVDHFTEEEAVAGQWLRRAHCDVHVDTRQGEDEDGKTYQVRFTMRTQSEYQALMRKHVDEWLRDRASVLFGLDIDTRFSIDTDADQQTEALRKQLQAEERKEVEDLMKASAELERSAAAKPEPNSSNRERPFRRERKSDDEPVRPLTIGRPIDGASVIPIRDIVDEMRKVSVEGRVFQCDTRQLPSGRTLVQFNITDESSSIAAKLFSNNERQLEALASLQDGVRVRIQGQVQFDTFAKEIVFMVQDMQPVDSVDRVDAATKKRVELHLHTTMSALDGVTPFDVYAKQAAKWGHSAIAITDHGGVQGFPDAYSVAKKLGLKAILGVEAYVVDDGTPIVYRPTHIPLADDATYVVFDTETTGLNAREDTLIEIAAVKMRGQEIVDTFATLIDPERMLSSKISDLTGITNDMLVGQPKLAEALTKFRTFVEGAVLVAHNAEFDVGFLRQCADRLGMPAWTEPVIDTLALARGLYPGEKNYKLKTLTQKFSVELVNHHRALADAEATAKVFAQMLQHVAQHGVTYLDDLNQLTAETDIARVRPFHATLLVRNQQGLRNLYELVSLAQTRYLHRVPRLPRSELIRLREGLLIGTACQNGELFQAFLRGKGEDEIEDIGRFYDYLEIQPLSHYENLMREELVQSFESVRSIHRQIVDLGKRLNKPVVATGDVHFLNPHDSIYREIFLQNQVGAEAMHQPPLYLHTTDEMLQEFAFLGHDCDDVVVTNTVRIADQIESVKPMPDKLFTPVIEGAEDEIRRLSYGKARRLYGEQLPAVIDARLRKELDSIINNGFAVIYLTAHKLVTKSLSDGYLVGSRGSVGSSLVATMTDITEVNPLPPHYLCPQCQYSEFVEDGSAGSGFDLPDKDCPKCGTRFNRDGQDIPFETFLGFDGDKVPDIDLNFSGEYQSRAHKYTEELFGKDHVFRAGTIATVAEKTAYGYVKKFAEERGLVLRNAEIDRLVKGCTGIKRTTGQHPGGQVVVPADKSIYEFTPVQYPADDKDSGTLTTHLDYHSGLEECLLKLDILGHDAPTIIRMLEDLTGVDAKQIPLNDPQVLSLFRNTEAIGVDPGKIRSKAGTFGVPEFGTKFVRQMLEDTMPTTFSELVRISGLSHGTDVWVNNAQDLVRNDVATLSEVICARDDIMVYLMYKGLEPGRAFKIMEGIRKGRGVKDEDAEYMRSFDVPEWYIESGRKIKYMFPKAHAAAYVIMSVRIAWFKVYYPLAFYATYFSMNTDDFDAALVTQGREAILNKIEEIEQKGNAATAKEKGLLTVLEVALEMVARGFQFMPVDLYESQATRFTLVEAANGLRPPFAAIPGVGVSAANSLCQARQDGPFLSIEDIQARSRVSKSVIEVLDGLGSLRDLPESNQLSLF